MTSKKQLTKIANRVFNTAVSIKDNITFKVKSSSGLVTVKVMFNTKELHNLKGYDPHEYSNWDYGQVGIFTAVEEPRELFSDDCLYDVETLERKIGKENLKMYRAGFVRLIPQVQGVGIGTDLYVRVAREVARYDAVLVPDRCMRGGQTSTAADRVWKSNTIKRELVVVGNNVFWGGKK